MGQDFSKFSIDFALDTGIGACNFLAKLVEEIFRAMAEGHHGRHVQETGAPLDGMKATENVI